MSRSIHPKYQASLSVEELLPRADHFHQQKWLLTYIDVFVLIIMLVLTLLALSSFEAEKKRVRQTVNTETRKQSPINQETAVTSTSKTQTPIVTLDPTSPSAQTITEIEPKQNKEQAQPSENLTESSQKAEQQEQEVPMVQKQSETKPNLLQTKNNALQLQLQKTVDELGLTESIKMEFSLGYAQLEIQDKVLFESSSANLLTDGGALLKKLAPLLKKSSGLIYIEGHTDNRPIHTKRFPSNWELGSARATSVLHYLSSQGLDSSRLRAVTYGDTKPIADNSSAEGREKNRRVSLVIKVSDAID